MCQLMNEEEEGTGRREMNREICKDEKGDVDV
jgi:hypothetical protein